jgi:predicted peptidase
MKCRISLIVLAFVIACGGFIHADAPRSLSASVGREKAGRAVQPQLQTGRAIPEPRGTLVEGKADYKYLCFLPKSYDRQAGFWPLIVFLHGASRDEDLEKLKNFGPIKFALDNDDFPFVVVAPATSRGWTVDSLDTLLNRVRTRFRVDRNRVYLTGHSMGGHATWSLAMAYPNRFAAIAPVSGAGDPRLAARRLRRLPVWVLHGEKDTVVPVECGLVMVRALKDVGDEVKSTIYPDRGHDICGPAYDNSELYRWFLQHRKK